MQAPLHRRHSSGGPPAPSYGTLPAPDESGNHDGDHARPRDLLEEETLSTLTLRCFVCICLGVFLGDASRGLVTPSLAPYVKEAGGDASFVGWTNGLYSMGRLVAAPLFGWWCEQRTYREAILVNLTLFFIGNLMYALAKHHKWLILFSRLLVGLGSGTLGLSRGYVAQTTSSRDRSGYMAWLTGAQFVGYSVTPGLGALFSFLNFTIVGSLQLNTYTTAGYLMAVGGIVNAVMMFTAWIEPPKPSTSDDEQMMVDKESTASRGLCEFFSTASSSILLFVVLMFMTRYVVAVYETSSQLIAIDLFNWSVLVFGLVTCVFGIVGTCVLFLQKPIARTVPDQWVLVLGLAALSLGLFVFPPLSWFSGHRGAMVAQYDIGSVLIFGLGYPISQALLLSFFSKALGPTPQSTIMGMMASLGSAAKVVGALIAGWSHQTGHTSIGFYIPGVILSLSTMGTAHYFFKRLIHRVKA